MLKRIHHAAIICSEYEVSKRFYTEILGLQVLAENGGSVQLLAADNRFAGGLEVRSGGAVAPWAGNITSVNFGGTLIDRSRATLEFGVDGRLAGRASCNTYSTSYKLTGESLTIGATATTMMSCAPSLASANARPGASALRWKNAPSPRTSRLPIFTRRRLRL